MRATGQVVRRSGRLVIADSVLTDSDGQEIARGTGTFMPSSTPLSPEIGYE
jgi:acyl-coenzyme A thioesterase PaaI-like protein